MRLFETSGLSASSSPIGRDRSLGWVVGARRTVVGSSCRWQSEFCWEDEERKKGAASRSDF